MAISIVMPAFSLYLGFWVVALRPADPSAWLLLALMISFSVAIGGFDWNWPWLDTALAWTVLGETTWPMWMFLFAVFFPEPAGFEREAVAEVDSACSPDPHDRGVRSLHAGETD